MSTYKPSFQDYKPENIENVSDDYREQPRPTFGPRLKNHFRRFWWLHTIIFLLGVLIVTLCLLYVGMPHIAQVGINASGLTLFQEIITDPTPSSVHLHMVTISESNDTFHPLLGAFNASLFLEDTEPNIIPFGYIEVPANEALHEKYIFVDQKMDIANMDQFIKYNKVLLNSETYRVAIRGVLEVHEEAFPPAKVNFNKVITTPGFNSLKGFEILSLNVSLTPAPDGSNMNGVILIPNPTPISVTMGQVVQNIYVDGQFIGNNTFANLTLNPGNNTVTFTGISNQTAVLNLIKTKYTNGILPVTIIGNSSIYNGQHLPYFEAALSSLALEAELNIGDALAAIGIPLAALTGGKSSSSSASSQPTSSGTPSGSTASSQPTSSGTPSGSTASSQPPSSGQPSGTSSGSQTTATS